MTDKIIQITCVKDPEGPGLLIYGLSESGMVYEMDPSIGGWDIVHESPKLN